MRKERKPHKDCPNNCADMKEGCHKKCKRVHKHISIQLSLRTLISIWISVFTLLVTMLVVSEVSIRKAANGQLGYIINTPSFQIMSVTVSLATFIVTSLFSFAILNHNAMTRELNEDNRRNSDAVNARSESFRTLQFVSSNFAIADFVDYVLMYKEYDNYIEDLKTHKNFNFYMREDTCTMEEIAGNFDDYLFLTIKMPIKVNNLKPPVTSVRFSRFKFTKDNKMFRFVPCSPQSSALILFNDCDNRSEVMCNLIVKKASEFFNPEELNPFAKMRVHVAITSLVGVVNSGWAELYFQNPQKLEKGGANKYKLYSSQFKASGLPTLEPVIAKDIANMDKLIASGS